MGFETVFIMIPNIHRKWKAEKQDTEYISKDSCLKLLQSEMRNVGRGNIPQNNTKKPRNMVLAPPPQTPDSISRLKRQGAPWWPRG